jgi:hypothetical protein
LIFCGESPPTVLIRDRDYDSSVFKVYEYSLDLPKGIIGFPRKVAYAGKATGAVIASMVSHSKQHVTGSMIEFEFPNFAHQLDAHPVVLLPSVR